LKYSQNLQHHYQLSQWQQKELLELLGKAVIVKLHNGTE
jgi:hypothetical protein